MNIVYIRDRSARSARPCVIVTRTDFRKEAVQPDLAFPAVGIFAFKVGKVIEWSDDDR